MNEDEVQTDITMPAISLLMESVRLQDELPGLKEKLKDPDRVYKQAAAELKWEEAETVELAACGLVAAQEGRVHERPAPRHAALLLRHLQDARDHGRRGHGGVAPRVAGRGGRILAV